jgi:hypothetical protein
MTWRRGRRTTRFLGKMPMSKEPDDDELNEAIERLLDPEYLALAELSPRVDEDDDRTPERRAKQLAAAEGCSIEEVYWRFERALDELTRLFSEED